MLELSLHVYTFSKKSSGGRPDVSLCTGEDANLFDVTLRLAFFRHLNNPLELGIDVVVAQSYRVDDDIQHEELQRQHGLQRLHFVPSRYTYHC